MDNDKHALDPAAALEASGDYRVLRKLPRRRDFAPEDGAIRLGVILDIETTGLDAATDEVIELGMLKFSFSSDAHCLTKNVTGQADRQDWGWCAESDRCRRWRDRSAWARGARLR